jgi:hypothetical protein
MDTAPAPARTEFNRDETFGLMVGMQLRLLRKSVADARAAFAADPSTAHAVQWKLEGLAKDEFQLNVLEAVAFALDTDTVAKARTVLSAEAGRALTGGTRHNDPFSVALQQVHRDAAVRLLGLFKDQVDLDALLHFA